MSRSNFYEISQLKNNLRIITEHVPETRSVALGFWISSGSRNEPPGRDGIGHFLEHLVFKGTPKRTARQIAETFDAIGGELNAFSAKEYTCVYAKVLDSHLPLAFDVIADMLENSSFLKKEIDSERNVVLEEIQMHEDSPSDLVFDYMDRELFNGHPLSKSILGDFASIGSLRKRDIVGFYKENYSNARTVIAAAGNIRNEQLAVLADGHFRKNTGDPVKRRRKRFKIDPHVTVFDRQTQQSHICLGMEGLPVDHPDRFALAIVDTILGGGMSSRLFQDVRESRGLVYSIYSFHSQFSDTGLMGVYAGTTPSKSQKVVDLVLKEIYDIAAKGALSKEIARAKDHIKGSMLLGFEDNTTRMTRLGKSVTYGMELLSVDELVERVESVTGDDIKRVAAGVLSGPRVLTVIGPNAGTAYEGFDDRRVVEDKNGSKGV